MPTFRKSIVCLECYHRFVALIQTKAEDTPSTQYTVFCPSNDSPCVVYRRDLTDEVLEPADGGVRTRLPQSLPVLDPWYAQAPWPAVIPVIWLLLAGLTVLVLIACL